jgi:two-component system OmpR family response regulator
MPSNLAQRAIGLIIPIDIVWHMTTAELLVDFQSHILVVDDDADLRKLIADFLTSHGYEVSTSQSVAEMRKQIEARRPELIILDAMMPGEDGLSAARRLAAENGPPVIMLSALGSDTDRIVGLEVGADDYLAKPCNPRELLARVRALLRRQRTASARSPAAAPETQGSEQYEFAGWRLDAGARQLKDPAGVLIEVSDGEFGLLRTFVKDPQRVLSRDQLLSLSAPGVDRDVYDRAIDSQISRLRRKLNERSDTELIRTVRNEGYMLLPKVRRV